MKNIKKTFILLMIMSLIMGISGCGGKRSKDTSEKLEEEVLELIEEERIEEIMNEFNLLISEKKPDIQEIMAFIDENIEELDKENGDALILELEDILSVELDSMQDEMYEKNLEEKIVQLMGENIFILEEDYSKLEDKELKSFIEKLNENYYELVIPKNGVDIVIDYDKLLKYSDNIDEETRDYLSIQARSVKEPIIHKGFLNINHNDIPKRLLKIEQYLRTYPHDKRYERMLGSYRQELIIYLQGSKKTPIVDQATNKFNKEVLSSYRETAKNKEDITSYIARSYNEIITENGEIMNDVVKQSVLSLVNEAIYHLEDSQNRRY